MAQLRDRRERRRAAPRPSRPARARWSSPRWRSRVHPSAERMAIDSAIEAGVPLADREPDPAAALPADDRPASARRRTDLPARGGPGRGARDRRSAPPSSACKTELLRVRTRHAGRRRCSRSCASATPGCSCSARTWARSGACASAAPRAASAARRTASSGSPPTADSLRWTRAPRRDTSPCTSLYDGAPTREGTNGGEDVGWRALLGTRLRVGSGLVPHRAPEGAAREADRALRAGDAREREALRRRAALPAPQLRDPRRERLPRADRARGVRRARREPRRLHDGLRDARPLRLRVDGHVLRHAHGRGGDDHAAPHPGADRQVHPPARRLQDRHAVLLGPRDRLALLVPVLLEGRALERRLQGQQEGVLDHVGRVRRLLRRADDQPGLQGLRRPVGLRHRRRGREGPAVAVGRARPARQPVRPDPGRGRRDPRPTRSSARSATARPPTTRRSTPGS